MDTCSLRQIPLSGLALRVWSHHMPSPWHHPNPSCALGQQGQGNRNVQGSNGRWQTPVFLLEIMDFVTPFLARQLRGHYMTSAIPWGPGATFLLASPLFSPSTLLVTKSGTSGAKGEDSTCRIRLASRSHSRPENLQQHPLQALPRTAALLLRHYFFFFFFW